MAADSRSWFWALVHGDPRAIIRGIAVFVLLLMLYMAMEIPFIPWARSFGLWPTLAGSWFGRSSTPGRASFVFLELEGHVGRGRRRIEGRAQWCERGVIQDYDLSGAPDNWRGTLFHASTRSTSELPVGLVLSQLRGQWSGDEIQADVLLISNARSVTISEETSSSGSSATKPPVLHYVLQRGGEEQFVAACKGAN